VPARRPPKGACHLFRDGVWKVSNSMWTVEPDACDPLRPEDPGAIRPRD